MTWAIIEEKTPDGKTEWQVSDGPKRKRSISYDFASLRDAELMLDALRRFEGMRRISLGTSHWETRK